MIFPDIINLFYMNVPCWLIGWTKILERDWPLCHVHVFCA